MRSFLDNYFVNTNYYQAVQQLDQAGKLHFVLGLPYEIESWMDMDEELAGAVDAKKFASKHVMPRWIKLLMDGTVETGKGFVDPLYPDGHKGSLNWTEEELTDLTRKANENGLTIHIHALGNKAVIRIMEIAVTGVLHSENGAKWWPEELVTREQALTAMMINGAKQMFIEDERDSIKSGKYADFLLVNKDVLTC